jgi:acetyl-CoA C-acetyltransferase
LINRVSTVCTRIRARFFAGRSKIQDPVVIVAARRTPIGAFQGALSPASAPELSSVATRACIEDAGMDPADIDEVLLGCVLPAGLGQAPARQAALAANLPVSVGCITINKVCGSGLQAAMLGHDMIQAIRWPDDGLFR